MAKSFFDLRNDIFETLTEASAIERRAEREQKQADMAKVAADQDRKRRRAREARADYRRDSKRAMESAENIEEGPAHQNPLKTTFGGMKNAQNTPSMQGYYAKVKKDQAARAAKTAAEREKERLDRRESVEYVEEAKVGDTVHLGHATKGGSGVRGKVVKIDGRNVHIKNDKGAMFKGPMDRVTVGEAIKYDAAHPESGITGKVTGKGKRDRGAGGEVKVQYKGHPAYGDKGGRLPIKARDIGRLLKTARRKGTTAYDSRNVRNPEITREGIEDMTPSQERDADRRLKPTRATVSKVRLRAGEKDVAKSVKAHQSEKGGKPGNTKKRRIRDLRLRLRDHVELEEKMDPTDHVKKNEETGMYCVYNKDSKKVKEFKEKSDADKYAIKNHDELMFRESSKLDEAVKAAKNAGPFTVVAIKNGKVIDTFRGAEHKELTDVVSFVKANNKGAKISVEAKGGKIIHTESVELKEAKAKDIVKGLTDMDGPFTVVAIKNNKVIKQENTKQRNMLPAIVKIMRKEVGTNVTIGIEDRKGTIRNTFKEDVELKESFEFQFADKETAQKFMREISQKRLGSSTGTSDGKVRTEGPAGAGVGSPTRAHQQMAKIMKKHGGKILRTDEGPRMKRVFKEDVEQVDEISSDTLRSYVHKRSGQVRSDLSTGKHSPKTNKKAKGVSAALSRLDARKNKLEPELKREEVEQVDELKKSTLMSYKAKAKQDKNDIARANQSTRGPLVGKDRRDFRNRSKGVDGATRRLVARQYEDVERIDELNRDTLGSYADKAQGDIEGIGNVLKAKGKQGPVSAKHRAELERELANRTKGRKKAIAKKYTREDTEQVDELKVKTLRSYISKAQKDNTQRVTRMADKPDHMKADKGEMDKLRKRQKGVVKAKTDIDMRKILGRDYRKRAK